MIRANLERHFGMVYGTAAMNLEGMTAEDALARPEAGGHCANWILGHLVSVHNGVMGVLGEDPVWEDERLDRLPGNPIGDPGDALDWDVLRDGFLGSRDRCLAAIRELTDEELAEEVTDPFGDVTSRAKLLTTLAFHQAYHVGQLGLARRVAGLPGAIRGPGQDD